MSTTESQIVQSEVPRPQGWNDEYYEQLVSVVAFARQLEDSGGSIGLLSLLNEPEVTEAAGTESDKVSVNWSQGTGFKALITSSGWGRFKTRIEYALTTANGHTAKFSITTPLAMLIQKPVSIKGNLSFNNWSALMGGSNYITLYTNRSPLTVNNVVQGELITLFPFRIPGLYLKGSFNWDS